MGELEKKQRDITDNKPPWIEVTVSRECWAWTQEMFSFSYNNGPSPKPANVVGYRHLNDHCLYSDTSLNQDEMSFDVGVVSQKARKRQENYSKNYSIGTWTVLYVKS